MRRTGVAVVAALVLVAGCGSEPSDEAAPASASPTPSPSPSARTGTLQLSSGAAVSYWCAGTGSPAVLLEAGTDSGGTDAYPARFLDPLVARTTVCTYDRPGTGTSDPPPRRRRTMSDLCAVQDEVLAKLSLRSPVALVGQSGGGNLNIGCAARHPERVALLVTIDSYHDDPEGLKAEGFVWTDNPEFVDYVDYSRELDTLKLPIGSFPVLVLSATDADEGGEQNQRHWLQLSPHSRQVAIEGPHNLQEVAAEKVVAEILTELRR